MEIKRLFKNFKNRLLIESLLKATLFSLSLSAFSVFVISLVYHILLKSAPVVLIVLIGSGVFTFVFIVSFILLYPNRKTVAYRIDATGLKERAGTMLEYIDDGSEIALLQRKDAVEKIEKANPKQIRIRIKNKIGIICFSCIAAASFMMLLPNDFFLFKTEAEIMDTNRYESIKNLIEELRQEVKESSIREDLKDSVNELLDDLETDLKDKSSELEQAAEIEKAKREIEELLENALTGYKIGEALQAYELTRELGEAISKGDIDGLYQAMDNLESKLTGDRSKTEVLTENLKSALLKSGVESSDTLYSALDTFASELNKLDTESENFSEELDTVFENAEKSIAAALLEQEKIKDGLSDILDSMEEVKDEVLGNEKEDSDEKPEGETKEGEPEGEKPDGEMPDGEKPDGEMPDGEKPDGEIPDGGGDGDGSEGSNTMTEKIYDPVSGNVSYGEVFAAYYAEYLKALEKGAVTDELNEIIDKYYSLLNP